MGSIIKVFKFLFVDEWWIKLEGKRGLLGMILYTSLFSVAVVALWTLSIFLIYSIFKLCL